MKSFSEDMDQPLDEIERDWVRVPVTIILTFVMLIIAIVYFMVAGFGQAFSYTWKEFTLPCFNGPTNITCTNVECNSVPDVE